MGINDAGSHNGDPPRIQVRLLMVGGLVGAVLLVASLAVDLTGANDVSVPQIPTPSGLPTNLPTGLPTNLPTDLPSLPQLSSGLPGLSGGGS
ncbi:hypothetical protein ABZ746_39190 [Streptomyces sp. NPDC020096]